MGAGGRPVSAREEELLGLLAGFSDGDNSGPDSRELSFSDLLVDAAKDDHAPAPRAKADKLSPGKQQEEEASAVKQQQEQAAARERRQRRQRSGGGGRGSCGGSGDGVLLNFYVPGLRLTRSMTAPRPGRGAQPPGAGKAAPAKPAAPVTAAAGNARYFEKYRTKRDDNLTKVGTGASGHRVLAGVLGPQPRPSQDDGEGLQLKDETSH